MDLISLFDTQGRKLEIIIIAVSWFRVVVVVTYTRMKE